MAEDHIEGQSKQVGFSAGAARAPDEPIIKMVQQKPRTWEYDFLEFQGTGLATFDEKLDEMGKQGWELTECFQLHNVYFFVMKRESTDVPKPAEDK